MNEAQKKAAQHAFDAAIAAAQGQHFDALRELVEGALELYPGEVVKKVVDDATVRRANALADAIEDARFGPEKK